MSTSVISINEFLTMTTEDILRLETNNGQFRQFCKESTYEINHPLNVNCLALKYFLDKFKSSSEKAKLFNTVFPHINESLTQLCDQSTNNNEMALLITTAISTICETVDTTFSDYVDTDVLRSLVVGVLDFLKQIHIFFYELNAMQQDHTINSQHHTSIMQSYTNTEKLRSKIITILTSNDVNYFPDQLTINDVKFFNRLIIILCDLTELASVRCDAKLLVQVWKCILVLCTEKVLNSIGRLENSNFGLDYMEYLFVAVKTICSCIHKSFNEIFEVKIQQNEQQFKLIVHSKAIKFLVSLLQQLASFYPHDNFRGHEHVLEVLLIMLRTANRKLQPFDETLYQNIFSGVRNVVFLICKSNIFVQCFNNVPNGKFSSEILDFGMQLIRNMLNNGDRENLRFIFEGNVNITSKMLHVCMSIAILFCESSLYKDLVVNLAGALLMTSKSNIDGNIATRFLVKKFLQNHNTLVGYLVIDVWCLWAKFLPELQLYNLVMFWSNINDKFSIVQPIHFQSVNIKVLLQNLYDLLSDGYKRQLLLNKPTMQNIKLWTTLGLDRVPVDLTNQMIDLETEIEALCNTFLQEQTDTALYKLIEILCLTQTRSQATENRVPDFIIKLWKLNFTQQTNRYSPLIVTLIRNSILFKRNLNNHQHYKILQVLTAITNASNLNILVKKEILNYLRNISIESFTVEYQNEIISSICHLFDKILIDSDPIVKQLAFTAFAHVTSSEQKNKDAIIRNCLKDNVSLKFEFRNFNEKKRSFVQVSEKDMTFLLKLDSYSYQHKCIERTLCIDDSRSGTTNDQKECLIREIIERMLNDTNELIELNKNHKFSGECQEKIIKLTEDLKLLK